MITFEKDTVEDAHIAASEDTPLISISVTSNVSDLESFIDKEYDKYVWRNSNSLLSKNTSSASECIIVYSTFNNWLS